MSATNKQGKQTNQHVKLIEQHHVKHHHHQTKKLIYGKQFTTIRFSMQRNFILDKF